MLAIMGYLMPEFTGELLVYGRLAMMAIIGMLFQDGLLQTEPKHGRAYMLGIRGYITPKFTGELFVYGRLAMMAIIGMIFQDGWLQTELKHGRAYMPALCKKYLERIGPGGLYSLTFR